jgi:hypothetical protein
MDPEVIPLAGMLTGLLITGACVWGVVKMAQSPIGQAIGRRIQGRHGGADSEVREELMELRERVELLHDQLAETHERLEFTERLLAKQRDPDRLPG